MNHFAINPRPALNILDAVQHADDGKLHGRTTQIVHSGWGVGVPRYFDAFGRQRVLTRDAGRRVEALQRFIDRIVQRGYATQSSRGAFHGQPT